MPPSPDYVVRPMTLADVPAAERLTAEGFLELDRRTSPRDAAPPQLRSDAGAAAWRARVEHIVALDAPGCWVAVRTGAGPAGELLGVAVSLRRELMWVLTTYVVRPGVQGMGVGRHLLDAALGYGEGCLRGMLAASDDPRAARRYRAAGFTLHPAMELNGPVDRGALPVVEHVREGTPADVDLLDSVDRQVRAAAHGPDHALLVEHYPLVVHDRPSGSGYAYVEPGGGAYLLAATSRRAATALLWETLAATAPGGSASIGYVTADNEWAVDVGLAARMELRTHGYLALRGIARPPRPYLPSRHFL